MIFITSKYYTLVVITLTTIQNRLSPYQKGCLSILFASLLWGTTGTVASLAPEISPLAIGAFSMGIGGMVQASLAYTEITQHCRKILSHKKRLFISALALAIYPLAFYSSMNLAGVAVGTVISIATAPFFSVLLECLFGKNTYITKQWILSFGIGVVGITLLAFSELSGMTHGDSSLRLLGIVLGIAAGLTYAIYSWVAKTMIDEGVPSQAAMGSIFGIGATLLIPTLIFTGGTLFSSSTNALVLGYMAVVPMCFGYIAFGFGLRHVEASNATLLTLLEPVVAAALAVVVVGELIPRLGWCGIGLITICLLIQSKSEWSLTLSWSK
ncbi:DMT family transporter [Vibrio profundum]|uniref:DMT family transporter n=1 Tax=Vibrio profundum TaxID=2910247 RepID=UPI003D0A43DE